MSCRKGGDHYGMGAAFAWRLRAEGINVTLVCHRSEPLAAGAEEVAEAERVTIGVKRWMLQASVPSCPLQPNITKPA